LTGNAAEPTAAGDEGSGREKEIAINHQEYDSREVKWCIIHRAT
jgi:hypothetical protein